MRSSDGTYVERLDHLRALAVFMVFFWHFVHGSAAHPLVPFSYVPPVLAVPISLLEEGHAGVSLFMVLSGYLFTRLIGRRDVCYGAFLGNRALRLLPMLSLLLLPQAIQRRETISSLLMGFVHNGWSADGTWSVMVEIQFYVLLPVLLALTRKTPLAVLSAIALAAIGLRTALWSSGYDVKELATYSLVGRMDNFVAGMALAHLEAKSAMSNPSHRPAAMMWATIIFSLFAVFYQAFNMLGGMTISADSPMWIGLPTVESVGFAALIYLYCGARFELPRPLSRLFARIGEASYSIYLLHFIVITASLAVLARWHLADWSFSALTFLSLPVFGLCFAIGRLTYVFIERPFLRLRVPYLRPEGGAVASSHISPRNVQSRLAA